MTTISRTTRNALETLRLSRESLRSCSPWRHPYTTLAIETSCDDTSVAVLEKHDSTRTQNGPLAQLHFHKRITANNSAYRGVHPIASLDSHERVLSSLIQEAIARIPPRNVANGGANHGSIGNNNNALATETSAYDAQLAERKPDFVAVTRGPGMRSSLNVGLNTAKGLALAWNVPLLAVHHMQAHALTPRLVSALSNESNALSPTHNQPTFPFLTLLVSGGHTLLLSSQSLTSHPILATTSDIALGDCIDKIARFVVPEDIIVSSRSSAYGPLLESFAFPDIDESYTGDIAEKDTRPAGQNPHEYTAPAIRSAELERRVTTYGWGFGPPLAETKSGRKSKSMEYSFTGLVSAVKRISERRLAERAALHSDHRAEDEEDDQPFGLAERRTMAREAMRVAFEHLAGRVVFALEGLQPVRGEGPSMKEEQKIDTLVVSGGVAANKFLKTV